MGSGGCYGGLGCKQSQFPMAPMLNMVAWYGMVCTGYIGGTGGAISVQSQFQMAPMLNMVHMYGMVVAEHGDQLGKGT